MAEIFDKSAALDRVDNDVELLCELVDMCRDDLAAKLVEMRTAVASGDAQKIGSIAHSLKSAFGNVGAMVAHGAALTLETAARKGDATVLAPLIDQFEAATAAFFDLFKRSL